MPRPLTRNPLSLRTTLFAAFFALANALAPNAFAQSDFFLEAITEFFDASERLLPYEDIRFEWNMDGRIQAELNDGINSLFEGNPSIAESSFNKVLEQDSSVWQATYYRGICRKQQEQYRDAISDFETVLSLKQSMFECYVELGKTHHLNKDLRQASKYYGKASGVDPSRPIPYFLQGNILFTQSQARQAVKQYRKCLTLDSAFHDARLRLALVESSINNNHEMVLNHLDLVLGMDPGNRTALLLRGLMKFTDNPAASLTDLDALVRVHPTNLMAIYLRGLQFSALGQYEKAFPDFHKVIELTAQDDNTFKGKQTWLDKRIDIQNVGAYAVTRVYGLPDEDGRLVKEAYCQLVMNDYTRSILSIDSSSLANKEPLCLYIKAVACEHNKQHVDALKFYTQALQLDNDIIDAHKKRAIYQQELKNYDQSIKELNEVLRINSEVWVAYKIRGISHYYKGNLHQAIDDYTQYLAHDTTDLEILSYRGLAHREAKHTLLSAVDFARSNHADVINVKQLLGSLDSLIRTGDTTACLSYLDIFTSTIPDFTEGFVMQIKLMAAQDHWDQVGQVIDNAIVYIRPNARAADRSYLFTIKGMLLSRGKEYDNAIEKLNVAITADKSNAVAFLERGKIWLARGKTNKAIDDLKKASTLGHPDAKMLLERIRV